jgi:ectoine hydroxylase-related dioxygenase (phytanoyl-CoA dioxygenase family)
MIDTTIVEVEDSIRKYRPEVRIGQDEMLYAEIASRNLERFDLKLTDPEILTFVTEHILEREQVKEFLEQMLGSPTEIDFDVSVVYSRPGACAQNWHADGAHQKGTLDAGWSDDGWQTSLASPYAICLFVPLIDLNREVGFTQLWPGSHCYSDLVGFGKVAELTQATFDGICQAGDGIWYDYRLLHRGMPNQSSSITRPLLQVVFKKKWYVEKANYGTESIASSSVS